MTVATVMILILSILRDSNTLEDSASWFVIVVTCINWLAFIPIWLTMNTQVCFKLMTTFEFWWKVLNVIAWRLIYHARYSTQGPVIGWILFDCSTGISLFACFLV